MTNGTLKGGVCLWGEGRGKLGHTKEHVRCPLHGHRLFREGVISCQAFDIESQNNSTQFCLVVVFIGLVCGREGLPGKSGHLRQKDRLSNGRSPLPGKGERRLLNARWTQVLFLQEG